MGGKSSLRGVNAWHGIALLALVVLDSAASGRAEDGAIRVETTPGTMILRWPTGGPEEGWLEVEREPGPGRSLIRRLGLVHPAGGGAPATLLEGVDPVAFVTVGTRNAPGGRPPEMSIFNVFFDSPADRPFQTFRSELKPREVRSIFSPERATLVVGDLEAGPFRGTLRLTVYRGSRLVHVEAAMTTGRERTAYFYDFGLLADRPPAAGLAWMDTEGTIRRARPGPDDEDRALMVRHRTILAEDENGSIACFPPPHRFFFPLDLTDNLSYTWYGSDHRGLDERFGFGIRQSERGGGAFVPWYNAPPGTEQRMGMFLLLSPGRAEEALKEALRYTRGDRFEPLPGYKTLASHWHLALAEQALKRRDSGQPPDTPDFVDMFKGMGVDILHLAEFHGDGHPQDPGPIRLLELDTLFAECRRLSDDRLLILPGEEANVYLGLPAPGRHAGHYMCLFPRPVYWTMKRGPEQPFSETDPSRGTVYHVGSREDMQRLLEAERGLAWTAHPRIKASSWTPDIFRHEDFFLADTWLGGGWKAMPADLSRERLGERVLDLLSDMANWGREKYVLGEVDVFKLDHTHELFGHMNVNYLMLDRVPRFDESWQPILDALRSGRFFVTTGEVLIPRFTVAGAVSGMRQTPSDPTRVPVEVELNWTFPLRFLEIVSGDGATVRRDRINLNRSGPFGRQEFRRELDLSGRRWVRAEAWDVAGNGAFTQPVWLDQRPGVAASQP